MARIPSTQALRAFECFARLGTVWRAAEELNVTRSAVSHQMRLLERDLGFALTARAGTRLELTAKGAAYAAEIRRALSVIGAAGARSAGKGVSGPLTLSCTPGFAASWLCPKIGGFREACPDIALNIVTPVRLDDVSRPEADLFISFGSGAAQGMAITELKRVAFTPLCSPALINRLGGLNAPPDVLRAGLLHLRDRSDWRAWLSHAGTDPDAAEVNGTVFADMNLVYAAALNGQGIAMGDEFICQQAMESGQLLRPFDIALPSRNSYRLAIPEAKLGDPAIAAFRDWLLRELREAAA